MSIKELLPIIVLIILIIIVVYFRKLKSTETFEAEEQKFNMKGYQINIGGNLFVGFDGKENSQKHLSLLKDAKMKFQDKMKLVNPGNNSIIIKGQPSKDSDDKKYTKNICLGADDGNDISTCINGTNITKFNYEYNGIPMFKDAAGRHVYYNEDQPIVRHNKLCFYDNRPSQTLVENKSKLVENVPPAEYCLEAKHLDMINGKKATKFKIKDSVSRGDPNKKNLYKDISPANVEYGPLPGFNQTVKRTFFMTNDDYNQLSKDLRISQNCYRWEGGRINPHRAFMSHTPQWPYTAKAAYMLSPVDNPTGEYSHVHDHTDRNPNI
jgi:hypothetical protein